MIDLGFRPDFPQIAYSMHELTLRANGDYTSRPELVKPISNISFDGRCLGYTVPNGNTIWMIVCSPSSIKDFAAFAKGHEETHVLQGIGRLDLLQERLNKLDLDINLSNSRYKQMSSDEYSEFLAYIGGFYSIDRQNLDYGRVSHALKCEAAKFPTNHPGLSTALAVYLAARKYNRNFRQ